MGQVQKCFWITGNKHFTNFEGTWRGLREKQKSKRVELKRGQLVYTPIYNLEDHYLFTCSPPYYVISKKESLYLPFINVYLLSSTVTSTQIFKDLYSERISKYIYILCNKVHNRYLKIDFLIQKYNFNYTQLFICCYNFLLTLACLELVLVIKKKMERIGALTQGKEPVMNKVRVK